MTVRKRTGFQSLNWIYELVLGSERYEAGAPSDSSSEDEGGFEEEPGVSNLQPDGPTSRLHASSSSFSSNDEEEFFGVGQVNSFKHHPLRSGYGHLALA